jgi:hypothetical protein
MITLLLLIIAGLIPSPAGGTNFVITNVSIFDGHRLIPNGSIWVEAGRIKAAGANVRPPAGTNVIDGTGNTVLPGLIDAHTHAFSKDDLKQALVFGVSTEMDMFTDYKFAAQMRQEQRSPNADTADLFSAGTLATARGGHGTEYGMAIPTLSRPEEAQAFVDARITEGSDYIKVIFDDGSTYGNKWPTLTKETIAALAASAHKRSKLTTAHIGSQREAREAIEAGVDGPGAPLRGQRARAGFRKIRSTARRIRHSDTDRACAICGEASGKVLAQDPKVTQFLAPANVAALQGSFNFKQAKPKLEYAEETIRLLKAAGVPLLAGTDAPNPGTVHGASLHREMEMLAHAGLTPIEALTAATSAPEKAFHLTDRGEIAAGRRADLVMVKGDPARDITATRDIVAVWKNGERVDREAYRDAMTAAANARPPAVPESGRISDFEDGTLKVEFGTGWVTVTDAYAGGKSSAQLTVIADGANGSMRSLRITGEVLAGATAQYAGASFTASRTPTWITDFSSKKSIRFWAKGDGRKYAVMMWAQSLGLSPPKGFFVAGPEWHEYTVPISEFGTDGHDIGGIMFSALAPEGKFSFQIDDVRVE